MVAHAVKSSCTVQVHGCAGPAGDKPRLERVLGQRYEDGQVGVQLDGVSGLSPGGDAEEKPVVQLIDLALGTDVDHALGSRRVGGQGGVGEVQGVRPHTGSEGLEHHVIHERGFGREGGVGGDQGPYGVVLVADVDGRADADLLILDGREGTEADEATDTLDGASDQLSPVQVLELVQEVNLRGDRGCPRSQVAGRNPTAQTSPDELPLRPHDS